MTDKIGILQFSKHSFPDPLSGHTIDDNARALLVALNIEEPARTKYCRLYLNFMIAARKPGAGWHNLRLADGFVNYLDSEDSQGRSFMACCAAALSDMREIRLAAWHMVEETWPFVRNITSTRAAAYTLIGMSMLLQADALLPELEGCACSFSRRLEGLLRANKSTGWCWFEDSLTYCNGVIPHALFAYFNARQHKHSLETAINTLGFLTDRLFQNGYLNIVGNRGWWSRGQPCPDYDQQPVDAASIALACGEAFRATGRREYLEQAKSACEWYFGKNINRLSLYDYTSGGCYDALVPAGVNLNQGAEAVLSLCLAMQLMEDLGVQVQGRPIV